MNKISIGLAAASLSAACASTPPPRAEERAPVSVATAAVEMTNLPAVVEGGGVVRARVTAVVASRVMAPISAVAVRAGDHVRRGDVLVTLDARDLRANQARADAAALSASDAVRAAEADVRASASAVRLATLTRDRVATLEAKRSATAEELDQADAALSAAEAQHAGSQARLASVVAARDAANAAADAAAIATTYATLTAPFDGIVADRRAEPGSMAVPGAPMLTLDESTAYRLEVRLDDSRAALVHAGAAVDVRIDASATTVAGHVGEIANVDPASHSFLVKIDLPAAPDLRSGQFGRAWFPGAPRRALTISATALVRRGQLTFAFLVEPGRRVRLRPVSIGAASGDRVELLAGLRAGDRVVVSPDPSLGDGAAVAGARP